MITKRKTRYLLVEASRGVSEAEQRELVNRLHEQLGLFSQLDANPKVVRSYSGTVFALRVNRGTEQNATLALCFVKQLSGAPIGLYTLRTSGTLRSFIGFLKRSF